MEYQVASRMVREVGGWGAKRTDRLTGPDHGHLGSLAPMQVQERVAYWRVNWRVCVCRIIKTFSLAVLTWANLKWNERRVETLEFHGIKMPSPLNCLHNKTRYSVTLLS
jgi:hypothetical protein